MNDLLIYANNGGLGLILHGEELESDFIENQSFVVNGEEIKPGHFSDLFGFFTEPMRFCGALKDKPKLMVFYSGDSTNLFEKKRFYYCVYWISETRIVNKYTWTSARDFNFKNGEWK